MDAQQVARGLGWFSLGLGVAELIMPGQISRLVGVRDGEQNGLVRSYGVREVVAGVGLLTHPAAAATWVWGRAVGDVLDIATVGHAGPNDPHGRKRMANSLLMLSGVLVVDVLTARALSMNPPTLAEKVKGHLTGKGGR